jgi:hypothetical protein
MEKSDGLYEGDPLDLSPSFDIIDHNLISNWEEKLKFRSSKYIKTISEDINLNDYNLSFENEKTIINDCERTRVNERFNFPDFEETLKKLLIYYCKLNNIEYKQGINELLGPFLLLKIKINISIPKIFNLFSYFIDNFLTNYYYEPELYAFRSSLSLLSLLLKYYDPELYLLFESTSIYPQMYATNWFLTTYANKNRLDIIYNLWNFLIEENDQLFIHFIVIAFLKYHRKKFLESDFSSVPLIFSKLKITDRDELSEILNHANEIKNTIPYSFRILVNDLEIFKPRSINLKEKYEQYNTDEMITLPILPGEILHYLYKEEIKCVDERCKNFLVKKNKNFKEDNECYFCKNKIPLDKFNYLIIDLRINSDSLLKNNLLAEGSLKNLKSDFISQDELINDEIGKTILEKVKDINYNIILLTNDTTYFNEYERKFYEHKNEKTPITLENYLSNLKKDLNEKSVSSFVKEDKTHQKRIQLKEYENIKNIIQTLFQNKKQNISYSFGGYKKLHECCLKYGLEIVNHNKKDCILCNETKNTKKQDLYYKRHNEKATTNLTYNPVKKNDIEQNTNDNYTQAIEQISVEEMNKYLTDPNNNIFHCLLIWHNMNQYNDKIIIIISGDVIKIFKMVIIEGGVAFDVLDSINYIYIKELKRDKNVFNLFYTVNNKYHDIKIDIFTDADGDNFNDMVNKLISKKEI